MDLVEELQTELSYLTDAVLELLNNELQPSVPLPRGKTFRISEHTFFNVKDMKSGFNNVCIKGTDLADFAFFIAKDCYYQPRKILRAIARIRAMTEWCKKRLEGMRRASEEILLQQGKSLEILETRKILRELSKF